MFNFLNCNSNLLCIIKKLLCILCNGFNGIINHARYILCLFNKTLYVANHAVCTLSEYCKFIMPLNINIYCKVTSRSFFKPIHNMLDCLDNICRKETGNYNCNYNWCNNNTYRNIFYCICLCKNCTLRNHCTYHKSVICHAIYEKLAFPVIFNKLASALFLTINSCLIKLFVRYILCITVCIIRCTYLTAIRSNKKYHAVLTKINIFKCIWYIICL